MWETILGALVDKVLGGLGGTTGGGFSSVSLPQQQMTPWPEAQAQQKSLSQILAEMQMRQQMGGY